VRNTLVINLFCGPGGGKSTSTSYIFSQLKWIGHEAELVPEFYKDLIWGQEEKAKKNQIFVFANQHFKIERLIGEVDFVIVDSPLLLSLIYTDNIELGKLALAEHLKFNNLNIFVNRKIPYSPVGREQEGPEALQLDSSIKIMLNINDIPFIEMDGTQTGCDELVTKLCDWIEHDNT